MGLMIMGDQRRADFTVEVGYDQDAEVWVVERSDVPGLTVEGASQDQLVTKIHDLTPILLAANDVRTTAPEVTVEILVRYRDHIRVG
jgi:hypothetical protein